MFIGNDWAGRPAVSAEDAHGLASGNLKRDHEHRQRHLSWANAHQEQAVSCIQPNRLQWSAGSVMDPNSEARWTRRGQDVSEARGKFERGELDTVTTPAGVIVPVRPLPATNVGTFAYLPQGMERGAEAGW